MVELLFAFLVEVGAEGVEVLEKSVHEDERSDDEEGAEESPTPPSIGAEVVLNAATGHLSVDTVAELVNPHQREDTQGEAGEQAYPEEEHGVLVVILAGDLVDFARHVAVHNEGIDAEGDCGKQDGFKQTAVGT